jgi:hypothetical protein
MASHLKCIREQAGLSAGDIARLTNLPRHTICAIDEERYDQLPAGIYARASVRAYARALGLDTSKALEAVQPQLPDAPLDLLALAELRAPKRCTTRGLYTLAAVIDAAVLLGLLALIVCVCSAFCAVPPLGLLSRHPTPLAILCAAPVAFYFWLLGAAGVPTAGPWLLGVEILPAAGPLTLDAWLQRGLLYASREIRLAVRYQAPPVLPRPSQDCTPWRR